MMTGINNKIAKISLYNSLSNSKFCGQISVKVKGARLFKSIRPFGWIYIGWSINFRFYMNKNEYKSI